MSFKITAQLVPNPGDKNSESSSHWGDSRARGNGPENVSLLADAQKAEFENNDRCCDSVKRLQRKETWTKKEFREWSPDGIGAHIVGHLIWVFGRGKKYKKKEKKHTCAGLWGQRHGELGGNRLRDKETDNNPKKKPCLSKQMAAG